jgi:hypothetical protein
MKNKLVKKISQKKCAAEKLKTVINYTIKKT